MSKGYGSREYWEERYGAASGEPEEWLQTFEVLQPLLERAVPRDARALVLGCGSSRLDEEMSARGWTDVISIDYAHGAMKGRTARAGLAFSIMDARRMAFADGSIGAIVDKGTLDALATVADDGVSVGQVYAEIARVLAPGGAFFSCSFSQPRMRQALVEQALGGPVEVEKVPKKRVVEGLDPSLSVNWIYLGRRHGR